MIQNKKLFIFAIIMLGVIISVMQVPYIALDLRYMREGWFYIMNSIFGAIGYTLLFISLKKTKKVKEFYALILLIATILFIMGILMLCGVIAETEAYR
jgi:hypothetical protein